MNNCDGRRFSWRHVGLVGRYYYPMLRPQIIWYPVVAALLTIVAYACSWVEWLQPVGIAAIGILPFMFYLAPLMLTRHDDRALTSMMPATALERWAFIVAYFFVAVPLLVYGVESVVMFVASLVFPGHESLRQIYNERVLGVNPSWIYDCGECVPPILCLWGVLYFKTSRTVKSIAVAGASLGAMAMIGGMYSMVVAFKRGYEDGMCGRDMNPDFKEEFLQETFSQLSPLFVIIGVMSLVAFVFMLWRCYMAIRNYQE